MFRQLKHGTILKAKKPIILHFSVFTSQETLFESELKILVLINNIRA